MFLQKTLNDLLALTLLALLIAFGAFAAAEPHVAGAVEDQIVITQTVTAGITISSPADVSMSRALTVTDDSATGSATWTVTTNNQSGYTLTVSASSTPGCADKNSDGTNDALCDLSTGEAFTDMATTTKATWSVSGDYMFGYSAHGSDVSGHGSDSDCVGGDAHTPSPTLQYQGFDGTTEIEIASSTAETNQSGTDTTLCLATEQDTVFAPSGSYQATTTATALVQ